MNQPKTYLVLDCLIPDSEKSRERIRNKIGGQYKTVILKSDYDKFLKEHIKKLKIIKGYRSQGDITGDAIMGLDELLEGLKTESDNK